jgi:hypothetical protein
MAISFVRSLRSLESDSAQAPAAALVVACLLVGVWVLWVVLAPVELHETSQDWSVSRDGSLIVRFPLEKMPRLRPGQPAELLGPSEPGRPPERWAAIVTDTPYRAENRLEVGTVRVELLADRGPRKPASGTVRVQVEQVTPLTLMLRASEPFTSAPPTSAPPTSAARVDSPLSPLPG